MSYIDWHVGMKVVAIKTAIEGRKVTDGETRLTHGQIYTIRELAPYGDTFHIRLVEVVNPIRRYTWPDGVREGELVYSKECFRPVQKRSTDISVFTAMLNKTTVWA